MQANTKVDYDIVIIGGGASGLTAALFAARRGLRTLVVTQDVGGQAATTNDMENYPGYELIDGKTLMGRFRKQAESFGARVYFDEIIRVIPYPAKDKQPPEFEIRGKTRSWRSYAVIMAQGLTRKHLDVPGETELYGKGVVYAATEEAPKFAGKTCAVVGGANSAAQAVLLLADICTKIYFIHHRDVFSFEAALQSRIASHKNVELVLNSHVTKINGSDHVTSIDVKNDKTGATTTLSVDGIFIEIGLIVKKDLIKGLAEINERGNIVINAQNETSVPGLFAAGDVSSIVFKQVVISAGEGAKAAMTAQKYLQQHGLVKATLTDWGRVKRTT